MTPAPLARVRWLLLSRPPAMSKQQGVRFVYPGAAVVYGRVLFEVLKRLRGREWLVQVHAVGTDGQDLAAWYLD